jgi:hypothetical protein
MHGPPQYHITDKKLPGKAINVPRCGNLLGRGSCVSGAPPPPPPPPERSDGDLGRAEGSGGFPAGRLVRKLIFRLNCRTKVDIVGYHYLILPMGTEEG